MPDPTPHIDFSSIDFPLDKLPIAVFRARVPNPFDFPADSPESEAADRRAISWGTRLTSALHCEKSLVEMVFDETAGIPIPYTRFVEHIENYREGLAAHYVDLGVAAGQHEATELVRDLERQAVRLAEHFLGRPR